MRVPAGGLGAAMERSVSACRGGDGQSDAGSAWRGAMRMVRRRKSGCYALCSDVMWRICSCQCSCHLDFDVRVTSTCVKDHGTNCKRRTTATVYL